MYHISCSSSHPHPHPQDSSTQLIQPISIYVNLLIRNVYVADSLNNRIQLWTINATQGQTILGASTLPSLYYFIGVRLDVPILATFEVEMTIDGSENYINRYPNRCTDWQVLEKVLKNYGFLENYFCISEVL